MIDHKQKVESFFDTPNPKMKGGENNLREALYAISELGLLPDQVDSISAEQAFLCWKIVQKLQTTEFPETLRM